jgi:PAS domain S-box-containing protein
MHSDSKVIDPRPAADIAQALHESEERFRATFEQAAVGIAHVALDGRWLLVNDKLCAITGYSRDELLARTFQDITLPNDLDADLAYIERLLAGEIETYTMEKRYIRQDGALVWVELTVSLVREASGAPKYFISVVEDISARKQAEAARRASEERYHVFVDAAPQLMWTMRPDGWVEFFNRRWYEFTGRAEGEMAGFGWLDVIHPDDRAYVVETRTAAIAAGEPYTFDVRFQQHDGQFRWHTVKVVPLRDATGTILAWFGAAIEIDSRRRAEEALGLLAEASSALAESLDYQTTLQTVARIVAPRLADYCLIDLMGEDGKAERVATAHRDPAQELLIQQARRYPPAPGSKSPLLAALTSGTPVFAPDVSDEWIQQVAQSDEHLAQVRALRPISVMLVPLPVRGRTVGAISFVRVDGSQRYDATDLKLAEDLARRAAQAIDNARLYHKAQTAIREREVLLSITSHELKSPLAALGGYAQLLKRRTTQEGTLPPRDQNAVHAILDQAQRLNRMLDVLLDLSRIESGQLTIARAPLELTALVAGVVEEMQATLETAQSGHTLTLEMATEGLSVVGDALRLEQVIRNLLGNAIKYSPAGGAIRVRVSRDGFQACVAVIDQGIGIPEAALPHLFDRFYRVSSSAQEIEGFGIGLYVAKEIVTQHAGTVRAESVEGHGSAFTVCLPLYTAVDG